MGASSSINANKPPKFHICKPLNYTRMQNIESMETVLKNYGNHVTTTSDVHTDSTIQNNVFESDVIVICIAKSTPRCFYQLKDIDYTTRCYKRCIYIMLDDYYNPNYESWIKSTVKQQPWISCTQESDVEIVSQFLNREFYNLISNKSDD